LIGQNERNKNKPGPRETAGKEGGGRPLSITGKMRRIRIKGGGGDTRGRSDKIPVLGSVPGAWWGRPWKAEEGENRASSRFWKGSGGETERSPD